MFQKNYYSYLKKSWTYWFLERFKFRKSLDVVEVSRVICENRAQKWSHGLKARPSHLALNVSDEIRKATGRFCAG